MAIKDRIREWLGEKTQFALPIQTTTVGGRHVRPNLGQFKLQVQEGLYKNAAVQGCISALQGTMNEAPLIVTDAQGNAVENHPLTRLFNAPNPAMSQATFWKYVTIYIHTGGNCYIHKTRNELGQVTSLTPYHDGQFAPVPGTMDFISHYVYSVNGTTQNIPARDVIHLRWSMIDPLNPIKGLSPIELCGQLVMTMNELDDTIYSVMKNNAIPGTVIKSPSMLNETQRNILREAFVAQHGADNRGTVSVITGDLSVERIAMSMSELQAEGVYGKLESSICGIFRVHPVVAMTYAGLTNSTYSNMESAFREYTNLTRVPMWNDWEEQMQVGLRDELMGLRCNFDTSGVAALKSDPDAVIYPVIAMFNANLITQNEARERTGQPAVDGGDLYNYQLVPAPTGFMDGEEGTEAKAEPLFSNKGGVITLNETKAAAVWKKTDDANKKHGEQYKPYVDELVDAVTKSAIGSSKAAKKLDPDNVNVQALVRKFMQATETVRKQMIAEIIELALMDLDGADIVAVQSFIDDIEKAVNREVNEKMTQATESMKQNVIRIVDDNQGKPTSDIAAALRKGMEESYKGQADVIARTTARAQTTTTQVSTWKGVNERETDPKKKLVKVWITRRDDKVRSSHEAMDGKWVDVDEPFSMAGDEGEGPGKFSAAGNSVNCRCIITTTRRANVQ